MTIDVDEITSRSGPRYRALAEALADNVRSGKLAAGTRLPTQRDLALQLGVTVGTVGRAYAWAEQRGLIACEVGRGSFVRARQSLVPLHLSELASASDIDLRINAPSPLGMDRVLAESLADLAQSKRCLELLRSYSPGAGLLRHRAAGAAWLSSQDVPAEAEQVVITGGAQGGLHLALTVLTTPGDVLLVEETGYPGLRELAEALRLRIEPVPVDPEGMVPEALGELARVTEGRVAVVVPDLQNPTTATMPEKRRIELAEVARRQDLHLVEDGVYRQLAGPGPTSLAALAPERVVHIASLSKGILPGLRLGLLAAPRELVPALARAIHAFRVGESPLLAELMSEWADRGMLADAAAAQRTEASARQAVAARTFGAFTFRTQPTSLHLWLMLPGHWRSDDAERELAARGVLTAPSELFWYGHGTPPEALRLSLGRPETRQRLEQALRIVAEVLQTAPTRPGPIV